jgi:hypothetical protein
MKRGVEREIVEERSAIRSHGGEIVKTQQWGAHKSRSNQTAPRKLHARGTKVNRKSPGGTQEVPKCSQRHLEAPGGVPQAPRDLHKRAKAPEESLLWNMLQPLHFTEPRPCPTTFVDGVDVTLTKSAALARNTANINAETRNSQPPHSQNTPTEPLQKQRFGNISVAVHVDTCTTGEKRTERVRQMRKTKKAECGQDRERESQRNKENGRDRETKAQVCNTHWHAGYVSHLRKYISVWVGIHKSWQGDVHRIHAYRNCPAPIWQILSCIARPQMFLPIYESMHKRKISMYMY